MPEPWFSTSTGCKQFFSASSHSTIRYLGLFGKFRILHECLTMVREWRFELKDLKRLGLCLYQVLVAGYVVIDECVMEP